MAPTHVVENQPPPLVGHDVIGGDPVLIEAINRHGAGWAKAELSELGRLAGSEQAQEWGRLANTYPPVLRTHDRFGHRIDEVEFHPAWHELLTVATAHGLHAAPWAPDAPAGSHVARAIGFYGWAQVEAGHGCPVSMTYAVLPALRHAPQLAAQWAPALTARAYDPRLIPVAAKGSALTGMAMTEKQGGSDVRANTTRATPDADGCWRLTGHKWFCSAPMSDAFLVLAQAPDGLSCFLVPRVLPDGTRNTFRLQRLKDKLGNRSNASAEIELDETAGWLVGQPGRGVAAIIEMVLMTRLDCVLGSAAGMHGAVAQAVHHANHRRAFGALLVDQPAMTAVLADLALESEAATVLALWLASLVDREDGAGAGPGPLRRIVTPAAKYWVCKRQPAVAVEALECLGGNGYIEESGLPRLFRESPLNGIWEGSGTVQALDVLRAIARDPAAVEALRAELATTAGADPRLDTHVADLEKLMASADESGARALTEAIAVAIQASLLVRHAPQAVADAFLATRVAGQTGRCFGVLPAGLAQREIVERARPLPA